MKKIFRRLIATTIFASMMVVPVSAMNINVEGRVKDFDSFVTNGTTVVQLRELTDMLGLQLGYNNSTKIITISNGSKSVAIDTVESTASVDNYPPQKVTVIVKNDKTYLPFRFIGEQFEFEIGYYFGMPTLGKVDLKSFMFTGKSEIEKLKTDKEKMNYIRVPYFRNANGIIGDRALGKSFYGTPFSEELKPGAFAESLEFIHALEYLNQDSTLSEEYAQVVREIYDSLSPYFGVMLRLESIYQKLPNVTSDAEVREQIRKELKLPHIREFLNYSSYVVSNDEDIEYLGKYFKNWISHPQYVSGQYLIDQPWLKATLDYYTEMYKKNN